MFGLGISEVVIILVIALIFIGPKKLPELAKGLGKGLKEFQNAMRGIQDSIQHSNVEPEEPKKPEAPEILDRPSDQPIESEKKE